MTIPPFEQLAAPLAGISSGNWLLAVATTVLSFAGMHAAVAACRRRLRALGDSALAQRPAAELASATLARTSSLAVAVTALLLGLTVLDLPGAWDERLRHLWFIALGVQLALYLDRAISIGARRYLRRHAADSASPTTVADTLIMWAMKTVLWVVFGLAMLSNLGINVSTFVASLGIGGIAVALAAQNILGDLFASLSIAADKPFEVGDAIAVAGLSGSVEHVGLKTTRIRADSGEQIVIGNAELLKNTVRNFKRMSNRRVQLVLRVNPATPPALARRIPDMLRDIITEQSAVRFERAHLKTLTQDALEFEMVFFVLDSSYQIYMDRQQAILLAAMEAFEQLGVSTANTTQHMIMERQAPSAAPEPRAPARALTAAR
ncbi:MAG: mechanosensitive ion channel family protein [Pseudomonadota bacterium]